MAAAAAAAAAATFLERGKRGIFLGILTLENDMLKIRKTCFSTCSIGPKKAREKLQKNGVEKGKAPTKCTSSKSAA